MHYIEVNFCQQSEFGDSADSYINDSWGYTLFKILFELGYWAEYVESISAWHLCSAIF